MHAQNTFRIQMGISMTSAHSGVATEGEGGGAAQVARGP